MFPLEVSSDRGEITYGSQNVSSRRQRSSARGRVVARSPRAMGGFNLADTSVTTSLKYGLNVGEAQARQPPRALAAFADADDDDDGPRCRGARVRANAEVARQRGGARRRARARSTRRRCSRTRPCSSTTRTTHTATCGAKRSARRTRGVDRESKYVETPMGGAERERRMRFAGARLVAARGRACTATRVLVTNAYKNKLKEDAAWLAEDTKRDGKTRGCCRRRGEGLSVFTEGSRAIP